MKAHVHQRNLMKNQIIRKFLSLEILKERSARKRIHFFDHLTKNYVQWVQNVQLQVQITCVKNNLAKKHVWLSIEIHFGIFWGFFAFLSINQNIRTQLCMNVKIHHYHMNYFKLEYLIFSLKFISDKFYLQKVTPQKSWNPFSFFWNPNHE